MKCVVSGEAAGRNEGRMPRGRGCEGSTRQVSRAGKSRAGLSLRGRLFPSADALRRIRQRDVLCARGPRRLRGRFVLRKIDPRKLRRCPVLGTKRGGRLREARALWTEGRRTLREPRALKHFDHRRLRRAQFLRALAFQSFRGSLVPNARR